MYFFFRWSSLPHLIFNLHKTEKRQPWLKTDNFNDSYRFFSL